MTTEATFTDHVLWIMESSVRNQDVGLLSSEGQGKISTDRDMWTKVFAYARAYSTIYGCIKLI